MPNLIADVTTDLHSGHHMHTKARLKADTGLMVAQTRTWTDFVLAGFHGGVIVTLQDADGFVIAQSDGQRFGVGTDRTDTWTFNFDPNLASTAASLGVLHYWDPVWPSPDTVAQVVILVGQLILDIINQLGQAGGGDSGGTDPNPWNEDPWSTYDTSEEALTSTPTAPAVNPTPAPATDDSSGDSDSQDGGEHIGIGDRNKRPGTTPETEHQPH